MSSRVSKDGRITIDEAIREQLSIYAGDEAIQRVKEGNIVIDVLPPRHHRPLAGTLRDKVTRWPEDDSWEALHAAAWDGPEAGP
jgi:hypothetical protein